ncbi:MAG TPA: hypothetical protein VF660_00750, partial [Actinomycetota bacterium]
MTNHSHLTGRRLPAAVITTLVALVGALMPMLPSTAVSGQPSPKSAGGVLPNFSAQGDNLIRLQVGAFDPLADPLPAPAGIPLVNEASL